jgi:hypothetical protein
MRKGTHHTKKSLKLMGNHHLGQEAWNKGLIKETDKRVKKYSENKVRRKKISNANKKRIGEKNNNWKGNKVRTTTFHWWVKKHKPKPKSCEFCNKEKAYYLANIKNHKYTRNPKDYKWLCRKCHSHLDFPNGLIGKNLSARKK